MPDDCSSQRSSDSFDGCRSTVKCYFGARLRSAPLNGSIITLIWSMVRRCLAFKFEPGSVYYSGRSLNGSIPTAGSVPGSWRSFTLKFVPGFIGGFVIDAQLLPNRQCFSGQVKREVGSVSGHLSGDSVSRHNGRERPPAFLMLETLKWSLWRLTFVRSQRQYVVTTRKCSRSGL